MWKRKALIQHALFLENGILRCCITPMQTYADRRFWPDDFRFENVPNKRLRMRSALKKEKKNHT